MPVDPSQLDAIMAAANKRYGGATKIDFGSSTPPIKRIPWGSLAMDMATWGGAPMGRVVRPWGGKHTAKSLACWGLARNAQQYRDDQFPDGLVVAYYNAEKQFDEVFVREKMGVDTDRLVRIDGGIIEDITYNMQVMMDVAHIHILDSIGNCISRQEFETDPDKNVPRGSRARAWSLFVRDVVERMENTENMLIVVDQIRTNQTYGHEESSGSNIWDHNSDLDMHHRKVGNLYRLADGSLTLSKPKETNYATIGNEVIVDGFEIGVEVNKSRVCRPFNKARMRLDLATMQWDRTFELMNVGIFLGVIIKNGAYYVIDGEKKSIHGEPKLKQRLQEDSSVAMKIFAAKNKYLEDNGYGKVA